MKLLLSARAKGAAEEFGQFFCRELVRAVDRWKANGLDRGCHGRGFGKKGFGAREGGNGMNADRSCQLASDGGVTASPKAFGPDIPTRTDSER